MTAVATRPSSPAPGATRPPATRDRFLDLLRAAALTRVVFRHALQWKWLGYFVSMPVMFFVAGSLFAQSVERRPGEVVTYDRLRRLLVPYWVFAFVAITVLLIGVGPEMQEHGDLNLLALLVPLATPMGASEGNLESFTVHLWYLRAYLWFVLLGVLLYRMFRRAPIVTTVLSSAAILLYAFGDQLFGVQLPETAGLYDFATYLPFWVLGYGVRLGWFDRLGARGCALVMLAGAAVAAWYLHGHPLPDNDPNASNIALFFLGIPWLFGLFALRAPLSRFANARPVASIIDFMSARALTIYLWHLIALAIVFGIAQRAGWEMTPDREDLLLGLTVVPVTMLFVLAIGWLEDVAARRPPQIWPRRTRRRVAA
jgi:peptidoglycan/LPS O-acetylase OafA/YrhL